MTNAEHETHVSIAENPIKFVVEGIYPAFTQFLSKTPGINLLSSEKLPDHHQYIHAVVLTQDRLQNISSLLPSLSKGNPVLCRKIIILDDDGQPSDAVLNLLNELGIEKIFSGKMRASHLKAFVNKAIYDHEMIGSSSYYQSEIHHCMKKNDIKKIEFLIKNFRISANNQSCERISSYVYQNINRSKDASKILKNVLRKDPTLLWAAWDLMKLYARSENYYCDAIEIAEKLSIFNTLNTERMMLQTRLYCQTFQFYKANKLCQTMLSDNENDHKEFFMEILKKSRIWMNQYRSILDAFKKHEDNDHYKRSDMTQRTSGQLLSEHPVIPQPSGSTLSTSAPSEDDLEDIEIEL
ncbi:MAG: hypothetical protein H6618_05240 [Deltaproteobacteria bacterium]|nr:hypothetical protein [Deltaproteobacteria bacterium]